jgi:hypothetical protein
MVYLNNLIEQKTFLFDNSRRFRTFAAAMARLLFERYLNYSLAIFSESHVNRCFNQRKKEVKKRDYFDCELLHVSKTVP